MDDLMKFKGSTVVRQTRGNVADLRRWAYGLFDAWGRAAGGVLGHLAAGLARARVGAGRQRRMRVVESLALGGRKQLLLVTCDEQEYLVGTGPESVETIVPRQPSAGEARGMAGEGLSARLEAAAIGPGPASPAKTVRGPCLVTPFGRGVAATRIREAENGKELWQ